MLRTLTATALLLATALPALAQVEDHPTGYWVLRGTECTAEKPTGFRIAETTMIMYSPGAASYEVDTTGKSSYTDLSTQKLTLTKVEAVDGGYHFSATYDDDGKDFEITLFEGQDGVMQVKAETGTFPLVECEQP